MQKFRGNCKTLADRFFGAFTNLHHLTQIPYSQEYVNLGQTANLGKLTQKSIDPVFCNYLFRERNTYTPTDIPQVRGNCDSQLNSPEGRGSAARSKTSLNNPDAALTACEQAGQDLRVPAIRTILTEKRRAHSSDSTRLSVSCANFLWIE